MRSSSTPQNGAKFEHRSEKVEVMLRVNLAPLYAGLLLELATLLQKSSRGLRQVLPRVEPAPDKR